jgi:hypothetical protein
LGGCAPTAALKGAHDAFLTAKNAGAKEKAVYEYYAAAAYLRLAKVVNEEKEYSQAKVFAEKSMDFSKQAFQKSGGGAK